MTKEDLHLHSNFSDGENSLEEMMQSAISLGYTKIAFTDHVRIETMWLQEYVKEIKRLQGKYKKEIEILAGVEAKVINLKGELDLPPDFPEEINLILASFHRMPKGERIYFTPEEILADKKTVLEYWSKAMLNVLKNPKADIIAHPTSFLDKYAIILPETLKQKISQEAKLNNKIFEINLKYHCPDEEFISILKEHNVKLSYGSDSHSVGQFQQLHLKR